MTRPVAFLVITVTLLVLGVAGGVMVHARLGTAAGPVYSLSRFLDGMAGHGKAWTGKTFWVRGQVFSYTSGAGAGQGSSAQAGFLLTDPTPDSPGLQRAILVSYGQPDPVLAFARRAPIFGSSLPRPQRLSPEPAIYRIRLDPRVGCRHGLCLRPVLVDAAPPRQASYESGTVPFTIVDMANSAATPTTSPGGQ